MHLARDQTAVQRMKRPGKEVYALELHLIHHQYHQRAACVPFCGHLRRPTQGWDGGGRYGGGWDGETNGQTGHREKRRGGNWWGEGHQRMDVDEWKRLQVVK